MSQRGTIVNKKIMLKITSIVLLVVYFVCFVGLGASKLQEFSHDAKYAGVVMDLPNRIHEPMSSYGRNHLIESLRGLNFTSSGDTEGYRRPSLNSYLGSKSFDLQAVIDQLDDRQLREASVLLEKLAVAADQAYKDKYKALLIWFGIGLLGLLLVFALVLYSFRNHFAAVSGAMSSAKGKSVAADNDKPVSALAVAIQDISHKFSIQSGHDYELELKGDDLLKVTDTHYPLIEASICEMVTNAIVHGGRASATRIADGKPATVKVFVGISKDDGQWSIIVADDGEGIDEMQTMQHALAKQLVTEETIKELKPGHGVKMILLEGFSEAKENKSGPLKSNTLSAIREAMMKVGGSVSLRNRPGAFCEFKLKLPS